MRALIYRVVMLTAAGLLISCSDDSGGPAADTGPNVGDGARHDQRLPDSGRLDAIGPLADTEVVPDSEAVYDRGLVADSTPLPDSTTLPDQTVQSDTVARPDLMRADLPVADFMQPDVLMADLMQPDAPASCQAAIVGQPCSSDAECGGEPHFCLQLYQDLDEGVCSCPCMPDDPATGLFVEDDCPGQPQNRCVGYPDSNFASCFQTCQPALGANACQGELACDPAIASYVFDLSDTVICAAVGCSADSECPVFGPACLVSAPSCPGTFECLPLEAGGDDGLCVNEGSCDQASHLCQAHDLGNPNAAVGDPCSSDLDCGGSMYCIQQAEEDGLTYFRNGYCTVPYCSFGDTLATAACPDGSSCNALYGSGLCQRSCDLTDAATCRGNAADRLGDYECRNYTYVLDGGAEICDFGPVWTCDLLEVYSLDCSIFAVGPMNQDLTMDNPTNMSCRGLDNQPTIDPYDPAGFCLDDTASSTMLRGQ